MNSSEVIHLIKWGGGDAINLTLDVIVAVWAQVTEILTFESHRGCGESAAGGYLLGGGAYWDIYSVSGIKLENYLWFKHNEVCDKRIYFSENRESTGLSHSTEL